MIFKIILDTMNDDIPVNLYKYKYFIDI